MEPANKLRGSIKSRNRDVQSSVPSLYIHLPFCKKKCNYCDFVSYAGKEKLIDEYVNALIRELESLLSTFYFQLSTIYLGGGTPTLLEPKHFDKIISTLIGHWLVPSKFIPSSIEGVEGSLVINHSEISIESNPATADKEKLKALRELGINRLSIGVQSFNNHHLKTLGRIHSAEEALRFYEDARSAGFKNINLDLIFALPNQTLEEWKVDLQTAFKLEPNHLSTYNLQIEENTPLWEMTKSQAPNPKQSPNPKIQIPKRDGEPRRLVSGGPQLQLPNEEIELAMYEYAIETLASAGYKHYEISNFAKPGFECRHNINYWKNGNYIGIGAGAHSHLNGKRWANPDSLEAYIGRGGVERNVMRCTTRYERRFALRYRSTRDDFHGLKIDGWFISQ